MPLSGEKTDALDMTVVDFDGVVYEIKTPNKRTELYISLRWMCFNELISFGAQTILERVYGQYLATTPEPNYNVTLVIDLDMVPADKETHDALSQKVSLLKRNLLAAPFEKAFTEQEQYEDTEKPNPTSELMAVHYREDETIYIQSSHDRVTVLFSTKLKDETDKIFGKVFLQEFVDARRRRAFSAPQVLYTTREPPRELAYLNLRDMIMTTLAMLPLYSSLNILNKCSKAYMHTRMRARVRDFLKVLNRAKPEVIAEKKTISGKTFVRT
ncbi:unnamed protein product [Absidia cylindrospora]